MKIILPISTTLFFLISSFLTMAEDEPKAESAPVEDKTEEKPAEVTEEKVEEKTEEKVEDKPAETAVETDEKKE